MCMSCLWGGEVQLPVVEVFKCFEDRTVSKIFGQVMRYALHCFPRKKYRYGKKFPVKVGCAYFKIGTIYLSGPSFRMIFVGV